MFLSISILKKHVHKDYIKNSEFSIIKFLLYKISKQLQKRTFGKFFNPVSQRVQMNFIFSDNVHILCLSCNVKKLKSTAKLVLLNTIFILHLFCLSRQVALTGYIFVIYGHWPICSFTGTRFMLSDGKKDNLELTSKLMFACLFVCLFDGV
jgi:hypothetical protein